MFTMTSFYDKKLVHHDFWLQQWFKAVKTDKSYVAVKFKKNVQCIFCINDKYLSMNEW